MKIIIKVLKGDECQLEVQPETTILQIKQNIQTLMSIPISHQKLIYIGKTLTDDKTIESYSNVIHDGNKIVLVVKKPDGLNEVLLRYLKKYYTEQQSEKLTKQFMRNFETKLKQYSLDDLERLAGSCLVHETN